MPSTPGLEIMNRVSALQDAMTEHEISGALIVQKVDLFYFSGTAQDAHLYIPVSGEPILMVRKNYERALEDSPLRDVRKISGFKDITNILAEVHKERSGKLGMELDVLPVNNFHAYERMMPDTGFIDISPIIRRIRSVKSVYEIEFMLQAAELNDLMFSHVSEFLREGMSEVELAGLIEAFYRKNGHQGYVPVRSFNSQIFYGHIMSGENLAVPSCSVGPTGGRGISASMPQGVGLKKIKKHEPIQVDYVAVVNGYIIDQARTFYLGDPPKELMDLHETALKIQNCVAALGKAGTTAGHLYDVALEIAATTGYAESFMGYPQPVPFVGHGIGLELDELPIVGKNSSQVLQEGMVIALEPKFIVPGKGLAGIENSFLVTSMGMKKLTNFDDQIQII